LVKFKKLAGGGHFRIINQSVPPALKTLGYKAEEIDAITAYATGRKTLKGSPVINLESLAGKGFTLEAIAAAEDAAKTAFNLEEIFSPLVLGRDFLEKKLKIDEAIFTAPGFSLLKRLGYSQAEINEAEIFVCGTMGLEGAPGLKKEHYAVFDTATPSGKQGRRSIAWTAHVGMMAACQPFISGAISKTINMPNSADYEDVKGAFMLAWKKALKAVALYRDGSKLSQPLSAFTSGTDPLADTILGVERSIVSPDAVSPGKSNADRERAKSRDRKPLPNRRSGYTQKAKIGGHSIFIRTGEYDDGNLGEIFLDMHKEGAAFRSLLNGFAIAVSLGLEYGVPLEEDVDAFTFSRFEPNGMVQGHDNVKMATSVIDYIFRDLAISYLKRTDLGQVKAEDLLATGTKTNSKTEKAVDSGTESSAPGKERGTAESSAPSSSTGESGKKKITVNQNMPHPAGNVQNTDKITQARLRGYEGDPCPACGSFTLIRNGTCMKCDTCGGTTGCS
jgi:ribonucleoside-diphosphate reductase alpha chain